MKERSWDEFRTSGMLWFINRTMHVFGWQLVIEYSDDNDVLRVYPARTKNIGYPLREDWEARQTFLASIDPSFAMTKTDVADLDEEDRALVGKLEALDADIG